MNRELPDPQRPRHSAPAGSARQADAVWIAGFIFAAVIGGLAACGLTHESLLASLLIPLLVAAVAVVVLRTGALDSVQEPASRHGGSSADGQRAAAATAHVNPGPASAGHSVGEPAPTVAYGTSDSQPYAWSWPLSGPEGDRMASAPTVAEPTPVMPGVVTLLQDPARTGPPPAADLSQFLGQVVIAQCPRCAAFRVAAETRSQDWVFGCHDCGWQWQWRPGTPWPEVHVRPDERGRFSRRMS